MFLRENWEAQDQGVDPDEAFWEPACPYLNPCVPPASGKLSRGLFPGKRPAHRELSIPRTKYKGKASLIPPYTMKFPRLVIERQAEEHGLPGGLEKADINAWSTGNGHAQRPDRTFYVPSYGHRESGSPHASEQRAEKDRPAAMRGKFRGAQLRPDRKRLLR